MRTTITIRDAIEIARPPAEVFDFTQDWSRRSEWDRAVLAADVIAGSPAPRVHVRMRGGLAATFVYRQFERPVRTSLALEEVRSRLVAGGGGSWEYAATAAGTRFTQSNSLVLRDSLLARLLAPLLRAGLRSSTRASLRRARALLETSSPVR